MTNKLIATNDLYSTSDLGTATLLSLYFPIHSIDTANPRKAVFYFNRSTDLNDILRQFWSKELLIEPLSFLSQLKIVKTRLYQGK